jgi:hypothetical protein
MLRASRREDRKRVPQYSSPYLPWWAALGRTYGNLPGSVSAGPARHPVGDFSHANPLTRDFRMRKAMCEGSDTPDRVGRWVRMPEREETRTTE